MNKVLRFSILLLSLISCRSQARAQLNYVEFNPVPERSMVSEEKVSKPKNDQILQSDDLTRILRGLETQVLNLKALAGVRGKSQRGLASEEYRMGQAVVKIPVVKNSPLYKKLDELGYIPNSPSDADRMVIEVPLQLLGLEPSRTLQSISMVKINHALPDKNSWKLGAGFLTASRQYKFTDSSGQSGDIGVEPGLGFQLEAGYRHGLLNLNLEAQIQNEKFKKDSLILINQETDQRYDVRLIQKWSWDDFGLGLGGGVNTNVAFTAPNPTTLNARHLMNPYLRLSGAYGFGWTDNFSTETQTHLDYMFGVRDGLYQLGSGVRGTVTMDNVYRFTSSFGMHLRLSGIYQEDRPIGYQQSHLGFQSTLGVQWSFGGAAEGL